MDAINQLLTPPTFKYLHLVSYLVYFMLLVHLPYMAMVLGASVFSLVYSRWKPGLSKEFSRLALGRPGQWVAFGLIPPVALAFLYRLLLYNTPMAIHFYLLRLLGILAIGFALLTFYTICQRWCEKNAEKQAWRGLLMGGAGLLLVLFYCFHLVDIMALLIFPEKWPFIKTPIPFPLFSITPLIHFAGFLCQALIITGAAILFFYFKWPEKRLPENTPHYSLLKYHGFGLLLVGSLLMPVVIFWDLYNLPGYSLSIGVFVISALVIIILFLLLGAASLMIKNHGAPIPRYSVVSFLLALLLFGLVIGKDRTLQANASLETIAVLHSDALKARKVLTDQREELYAKALLPDEKMGEKIYNDICTACHSFDKKVLGPPFNDVLPKYADKQDDLAAFLKNPKKINPQFPAMPNPGLTTIQIKSVIKFLMMKIPQASLPPAARGSFYKNRPWTPQKFLVKDPLQKTLVSDTLSLSAQISAPQDGPKDLLRVPPPGAPQNFWLRWRHDEAK